MTALVRTALASARRSPGGRVGLGLATLLMAAAIIGMHSWGAGHDERPLTVAAGSSVASRADSAAHSSMSMPDPVPAVDSPSGECVPGCATANPVGHTMGMVCVGILTALVLALLGGPGRHHSIVARRRPAGPSGRPSGRRRRAPPPHLSPSLSKLCILRT